MRTLRTISNTLRLLILSISLMCASQAAAQTIYISAGTEMSIAGGTDFSVDGLTMMPSAVFSITDENMLTRSATVVNGGLTSVIPRVYKFANTTSPFSGSFKIYYDESDVTGFVENTLALNLHDGSAWTTVSIIDRNPDSNFVLSAPVSNVSLNELALTGSQNAFPVTGLTFSTEQKDDHVLLRWSTLTEQNTDRFGVEHSLDGRAWKNIAWVAAAGNSTSTRNYSYLHMNPVRGLNYYRILQKDLDGRSVYSRVRTERLNGADGPFKVLNNPAYNGNLNLYVNQAGVFNLYTSDGKLLESRKLATGNQYWNLGNYAKGTYFLSMTGSGQQPVRIMVL
jgi:hypothetical protein